MSLVCLRLFPCPQHLINDYLRCIQSCGTSASNPTALCVCHDVVVVVWAILHHTRLLAACLTDGEDDVKTTSQRVLVGLWFYDNLEGYAEGGTRWVSLLRLGWSNHGRTVSHMVARLLWPKEDNNLCQQARVKGSRTRSYIRSHGFTIRTDKPAPFYYPLTPIR